MYLVQILLPLNDNDGKKFSSHHFISIEKTLADKFGGITAYSRSPAVGLWRDSSRIVQDEIIIFEIMTDDLDKNWWIDYRKKLESLFKQDCLVIRAMPLDIL